MRYLVYVIFSICLIASCSKSSKEDQIIVCPAAPWIELKKAEYSSCTCLTGIYQGTYKGQTVFEIRGMDPLCNGINMVYYANGEPVLSSGDQAKYQSYLSTVQNLQLIWSCSKPG